jgi:hypothetical protein
MASCMGWLDVILTPCMAIVCQACGATYQDPGGDLSGYYCTNCGNSAFMRQQAPSSSSGPRAVAGGAIGATIGGVLLGPGGALLGGILGAMVGGATGSQGNQ